jgi:ferritin-like metal-binding protein YciE
MKLTTLEDLFLHKLEDLLSAEKQLLTALPEMADAANDPKLRTALQDHLVQTETHLTRIERVFEMLGKKPKDHVCKAMKGLIQEETDIVHEDAEPAVHDAALIAAAQSIEHYEIAAYGTVSCYAELLSHDYVAGLLAKTLDEEKAADEKLTEIATEAINLEAAEPVGEQP